MSRKDKEKKVKKVKKYASGIEDRIKQVTQIKPPELDKMFVRENDEKVDHWRPLWRTDWKSISEQRRLEKRHNRPKRPKKRFF